jgi:hypothetical protein
MAKRGRPPFEFPPGAFPDTSAPLAELYRHLVGMNRRMAAVIAANERVRAQDLIAMNQRRAAVAAANERARERALSPPAKPPRRAKVGPRISPLQARKRAHDRRVDAILEASAAIVRQPTDGDEDCSATGARWENVPLERKL